MRICVVGTGYVGLVAGACFAGTGNHVVCVDIDPVKVGKLDNGIVPIYEPGLTALVKRNAAAGRLDFTTHPGPAIQNAEVVFLAVGTPQGEDGSADLQYVVQVAETVGENPNGYKVIVVKSTVPVGTCDIVRSVIAERSEGDFDVVSNPEFLKEGAAVNEFLRPDRVVVGILTDRARDIMEDLYTPFMRRRNRIIVMDIKSSEMTKYASNAMLATKISFINEMARLCDEVGADVESVRIGMAADKRIGPHFIFPGCGYGGSCFPKDIKALVGTGAAHGVSMEVLKAVERVNDAQKMRPFERLRDHFGDLRGKKVAVWGLAFKPETDDMRYAPSEVVIRALLGAGAEVRATDPEALEMAASIFGGIDGLDLLQDAYACAEGADALVVCTEWNEYRTPDFKRLGELMRERVLVDGRNLYRPSRMKELGYTYYAVGRPTVVQG